MRRLLSVLLGMALTGATMPAAVPNAHWHLVPDYPLIIAADAPDDPDSVPPVAPPMVQPQAWPAPRLFGQSASDLKEDLVDLPTPVSRPFSVELWISDHVSRPVGALLGGVDADGKLAWSLRYFSALGNGKFDAGAAIGFGPLDIQPVAGDTAVAPWRRYLHHLIGTYDGRTWRLYHDGVLVREAIGPAAPFERIHLAGYLGAEPHMQLANLVRDVWVHDHALSANEVRRAFAARQAEIEQATRGAEPGLRFTAGPYLTPPGTTAQKLLWETDHPAAATLDWGMTAKFDHHLAFDGKDRLHRATLDGLIPDTVYFYRITATDADGQRLDSGTLAFRTMPAPGAPLIFAAMGDTQERPFINARLSRIIWEQRPHFLVLAGDLVGGEEDERRWHWTDEYFTGMGPLVARVPVLAARGNGDVDLVDAATDKRVFTNFDRYHNQPDDGRGYYGYRISDADFFVLDGNLALRERQEPGFRARQRAWLADALARSTARWKIAVHHQPAYSADDDDYGDGYAGATTNGDPDIRKDFVDLYERYGVDLVLSGHIHDYERTWPIRNGKPACGGVTYLQLGGGGGDHEQPAPVHGATTAALYRGFHVGLFRLWQDRLDMQLIDSEGRMRDSLTLQPHAQALKQCAP